MYEYGLRNCDDTPQEYKLSHILASYRRGIGKYDSNVILTTVGVPDDTIKSDGSIDFWVPERSITYGISIKRLCKNIRLAWQVFTGRASIIYYE